MSVEAKNAQIDQYKGWLYKWTNYIKGYQKRWFVLQNGLLSYYRNQAEMSHTCRGTINLANAFIHTEDSCTFVISNGGTQTFHLKASSEIERQRWVTALELAKAKAISVIESEEEELDASTQSQPDKTELQTSIKTLNQKLEDLNTCNDLIAKHGTALQRALTDLEQLDHGADAVTKVKAVGERATLFRITSNAMINACKDYVDLAQGSGRRWLRLLQHEHEQRLRLEEMVETLAKQHSSLEKAARMHGHEDARQGAGPSPSDEEDDFFDAVTDHQEFKVSLPTPKSHHIRTPSGVSTDSIGFGGPSTDHSSDSEAEPGNEARVIKVKDKSLGPSAGGQSSSPSAAGLPSSASSSSFQRKVVKQRRKTIPDRPNASLNLWGIMKNCIGKELSKIPMPVNFSEPLSFLQRLTEDFEYAEILHQAAKCTTSWEQLAYVTAFTVSSYATTTSRTGKPFNPLLGETYECDRTDDLGWRSLAEQVSHHPPTCAMHTEGRHWTSYQEFTMSSKFRGKYLQIIPLGIAHLLFPESGNHYTWRKVTTTVHNIIVGKLWVDNHGEMEIKNHHTGDSCHIKYAAYSYFSRETPRKVTGVVTDSSGTAKYVIQGTWDDFIEGAEVIKTVEQKGKTVFETGPTKQLWKRKYPPPEYEKIYNFTQMAVELNEPEDGVAPTDSRLRPDQRQMELGNWDEANKLKVLLEEKQRAARRKREAEASEAASSGSEYEGYQPAWFKKDIDPQTGNTIHVFTNNYWDCKTKSEWTKCPDIYL